MHDIAPFMRTMPDGIREPFGRADCESEVRILKSEYSELYFDETPFNDAAIRPESYLIIGRRGSGKTALSQYFSFQKKLENAIYISVDRPETFQKVLSEIASRASESRELAIPRLRKVWEYILWCIILQHTNIVPTACTGIEGDTGKVGRVSQLVNSIIDGLLRVLDVADRHMDDRIQKLVAGKELEGAKAQALSLARKTPIIVTLDTLEQYDVNNTALMNAMAALVECASAFNLGYSDDGIHLKVFMSGEVFPYLQEEVLLNTLKSIRDPVYLFWRPKDLLRLISWRFHRFLVAHDLIREDGKTNIDWTNHHQVMDRMWTPYFGKFVTNNRGIKEHTFPYVLRHTQMRPRQLIVLCNSIAEHSKRKGRFPVFDEVDIREGVRAAETTLAVEIINSFSSLYPHVGRIVDALMKMPKVFLGNELDKRAKESASEWPRGTYSPSKFRRLVAELGIVGRVRRHNKDSGFIDADFEYSLRDRLPITHRDECVIHPMFYTRLAVDINSESRVMPFSTDREAAADNDDFSM